MIQVLRRNLFRAPRSGEEKHKNTGMGRNTKTLQKSRADEDPPAMQSTSE